MQFMLQTNKVALKAGVCHFYEKKIHICVSPCCDSIKQIIWKKFKLLYLLPMLLPSEKMHQSE